MWANGSLVAPSDRVLRADDHALVGYGAFEAIKVLDGRPFALRLHLDRLVASAAPLGIAIDLDLVRVAVDTILATPQASVSPSWLRITVTGGSAPMATGALGARPSLVVALAPMKPWPPTCDVVVTPWTRNERGPTAGLKTISYADNVIGLRYAHRHGGDEAIFANSRGDLCEGAGSNVFVSLDGRLVTPPLSSGCLAGVTRQLLLECCPDIAEADVPIAALGAADEAFLTSTSRDVHPIRTVDGQVVGAAAPGPLTLRAMETWRARAAALTACT
jgi:branched-chain amino acid aminotransferase